jgi:formylglycine-generating enzyme required for sulfatase activity
MYPVESLTWDDALAFCKNLSELPEEKKAGRIYRLPTEAEWEYACRAGSKTAYSFGANSKSLGNYAWFADNSGSKKLDSSDLSNRSKNNPREYLDTVLSAGCLPHPVGEKNPNAWGLYDMHGNVLEWCSDFYGAYPEGAVSDPMGPKEGLNRMMRGGSWTSDARNCRSTYRQGNAPDEYYANIGFRVALSSSGISE